MMSNNRVATIKINGEEKEIFIRPMTLADRLEGQKVYNKAINSALASEAPLREKLDDVTRQQGLWDDKKDKEFTQLQKELRDAHKKLHSGGIKLEAGKQLALTMMDKRQKLVDLLNIRNSLDSLTAQGQAESHRMNYYVAVTAVYNDTKQPVFADTDEYLQALDEGKDYATDVTMAFVQALSSSNEEDNVDLPEIQFLKKNGFMNEKGEFINKDGKPVDKQGRLIDDKGRWINEDGQLINIDGDPVDEDGNLLIEHKPFLDDDGNEIVEEQPKTPQEEEEVKPQEEETPQEEVKAEAEPAEA